MKGFENDIVKMELVDGVLISEHHSDKVITLEEAKVGIELRMKHIGDYPYPILSDARSGKGATREAQRYVLKIDDKIGTPAIAIVVDSLVSRVFGNIVLSFMNNTSIDIRLFLDRNKAMNWLKKYVEKQMHEPVA